MVLLVMIRNVLGSMTESEDLKIALAGDARAFDRLVVPLRRQILAHCYRMSGSHDDAEEVTQEALLRAWRSLTSFEGRSSLRSWLYRIATNACLNEIESGKRRRRHLTGLSQRQPLGWRIFLGPYQIPRPRLESVKRPASPSSRRFSFCRRANARFCCCEM